LENVSTPSDYSRCDYFCWKPFGCIFPTRKALSCHILYITIFLCCSSRDEYAVKSHVLSGSFWMRTSARFSISVFPLRVVNGHRKVLAEGEALSPVPKFHHLGRAINF